MDQHPIRDLIQLAKGAGVSVLGKFIGRIVAVLGDIIAARILGSSLFGLYSIGWTLLRIVSLIAPLGLANGVIRYIPKYINNNLLVKSIIFQSLITAVSSGTLMGVIVYFLSPLLALRIFNKPDLVGIFQLFSLSLPFIALLSVTAAITRSSRDMKYSVIIEDIGQPFVSLIFLFVVYYLRGSWLKGVILSDVISYFIAGIISLYVTKNLFKFLSLPGFVPFDFSEVLRYSFPTALAGTFSVFVFWVDRLLVGYFLSSSETGVYQAASQLSVLFVLIIASFNAILSPMFSSYHSQGELKKMQEIYRIGTKWGLYISMPIFLIFIVFPKETLSLFYGNNFSGGWQVLLVLTIGQVIYAGTGSVGSLLTMSGHEHSWFYIASAALLVNLIIGTTLIPLVGILGAALSTSISLSIMFVLGLLIARKFLGLWPYDVRIYKGAIASVVSFLGLVLIQRLFNWHPVQIVLISALFVLILFYGTLYLLRIDEEDRLLMKVLIKSLLNRNSSTP